MPDDTRPTFEGNTGMPPIRRTRAVAVRLVSPAAALATASAVAGCTVEDKKEPTAPAPDNSVTGPAVAPGVTADSIRIGVVYPDFAPLKPFVNLDAGDFEATYKALIDKINAGVASTAANSTRCTGS